MASELHDPGCKWPNGAACRRFSTDGTRLGAEIAHTMGTTDEEVIVQEAVPPFTSDVAPEQADWDSDDWDEGGLGLAAQRGEPGPHPHQEEPMRPYPASKLDWN